MTRCSFYFFDRFIVLQSAWLKIQALMLTDTINLQDEKSHRLLIRGDGPRKGLKLIQHIFAHTLRG